jgi:hypothetical protein
MIYTFSAELIDFVKYFNLWYFFFLFVTFQTLGLGNLIQSSALPDCLLRIEKNPSTTREGL